MIGSITLSGVLPHVFADSIDSGLFDRSGVWLREVEFRRGGRYLVSAESGTGKSSLVSFLYGLRDDYSGTVRFDGCDIRRFGVDRWCELRMRALALLPQEMRLFPELTVIENIEIKNRLTGYRSRHDIDRMLERLEIAGKAGSRVATLSIGQQQRVAVVRALCQPFDFILLDEPVSHLDDRNNAAVAGLVNEEATDCGAAVIATSVGYSLKLDNPEIIYL